jgi:hypothetical protein
MVAEEEEERRKRVGRWCLGMRSGGGGRAGERLKWYPIRECRCTYTVHCNARHKEEEETHMLYTL